MSDRSGFPEHVRSEVDHRSQGMCELAGPRCLGRASHFHHRQLRRHSLHTAPNCLHLCSACHNHVHNRGDLAYQPGWLVHSWDDPADIPVYRWDGSALDIGTRSLAT